MLAALLLLSPAVPAHTAPVSTAFNYQGRLIDNGAGASGRYDVRFRLFNDSSAGGQVGPAVTVAPLSVSNGLFTAQLDFGASVFDGTAFWLEIGVRTNGSVSAYAVLNPRQSLTATPYALHALSAASASAVAANAITTVSIQDGTITAAKLGAGQLVMSLNGLHDHITLAAGANLTLTPSGNTLTLSANTGWSLSGNSGTDPATQFLGTTDSQPLVLRANNDPVLRLVPASIPGSSGGGIFLPGSYAPNVIAGNSLNDVPTNVAGATISGGGSWSLFNPRPNTVRGNFSTISGGVENEIRDGAQNSVIGGGSQNTIRAGVNGVTVGGGLRNETGPGGYGTSKAATVAGGELNNAEGDWSAVPGGYGNWSPGRYSFAAGRQAKAFNDGSFVWADSTASDYVSGGPNTFNARATGGVNFHTGNAVVWTEGELSVKALTIRGGADLAEPFESSEGKLPPGSVVVIDEANPGKLKLATEAYDTRVAVIISGAGGVNAGIALHQEGVIEGGQNVALTGRVYVQADAGFGAIKPGDLLTTSRTPGHAMKVGESSRAQGAILGKAMTALAKDKGLVLVLVTLQ